MARKKTNDKPSTTTPEHHTVTYLNGMYEDYFLDYASYVILERAVPHLKDGLKPVQRRILHSMYDINDGRFHKVANIIGHTMQYHPHGDAAIGDALVNLGQKDLLIETQGNWGDIRTGDSAAAPIRCLVLGDHESGLPGAPEPERRTVGRPAVRRPGGVS